MKIFFTRKKWQIYRESLSESIGFVPTMGALHEGHLQLIAEAKQSNDFVIVSIFVNPKQFNNSEDLRNYPKTISSDLHKLQMAGVNAVFIPSTGDVYPENDTYITAMPGSAAIGLEGAFRPGHFEGVVNVVDRLFHWINPHGAYFGQKDLQQCLVIQEFAKHKYPQLHIYTIPTVRESTGLAMSSRNVRLSAQGRARAAVIYNVLNQLSQNSIGKAQALQILNSEGIDIEYLELKSVSLQSVRKQYTQAWLFAGYLEGIRLIDNVLF